MSSAQGVHYIGRDLSQNLGNPPTASVTTREGNPDYFVLERIWELLKSNHPACTWPKSNADQLLVLLVTELQTTPRLLQYETKPRMLQHERGMDNLQDAYESIVQELVSPRRLLSKIGFLAMFQL